MSEAATFSFWLRQLPELPVPVEECLTLSASLEISFQDYEVENAQRCVSEMTQFLEWTKLPPLQLLELEEEEAVHLDKLVEAQDRSILWVLLVNLPGVHTNNL